MPKLKSNDEATFKANKGLQNRWGGFFNFQLYFLTSVQEEKTPGGRVRYRAGAFHPPRPTQSATRQ